METDDLKALGFFLFFGSFFVGVSVLIVWLYLTGQPTCCRTQLMQLLGDWYALFIDGLVISMLLGVSFGAIIGIRNGKFWQTRHLSTDED